jgi:ATP-dependent Clp protease ATP-binding subunit ClpA
MYSFGRFTERAKHVLTLAQQEAEAAGHSYIGTEHLLLGILSLEQCLGCVALKALGVQLEPARAAIAAILGEARVVTGQIIPTARVKTVIELSFEAARAMDQAYVGTEHMVLGILIEGKGVAAKVLDDMGVTEAGARAEIERLLTEGVTEPPGQPTPTHRFQGVRPLSREVGKLMQQASALAGDRGSTFVGLDHLLDAMTSSAGIEALARLLDVRRHAAAKEQAIASQEYERAAADRTAERRAREALDQAIAAWRGELAPPEEGAS